MAKVENIPFRCPRCGGGKYGRNSHMCKQNRKLDRKKDKIQREEKL